MSQICPTCGGKAKHYDYYKRLVRGEYGRRYKIDIERFRCRDCRKIFRILPDNLLPYKQYERAVIEMFVNDDSDIIEIEWEDYPCESIKNEWRRTQKSHPFL